MAGIRRQKGVQNIRTTRALLDSRRVKSSAAAFTELAALAMERQRLQAEVERWVQRQAEIQVRLKEIGEREARLQLVVSEQMVQAAGQNKAAEDGLPASRPLPAGVPARGLTTRELNY